MAPTDTVVRYVVDENLLRLGRTLVGLRSDIACFGTEPVADLLPPGILDTAWIPLVGDRSWVVITNDRRLRTRPLEAALAVQHKLMVIHLHAAGNLTAWDQAVRLLSQWERVARHVAAVPEGPWWLSVRANATRVEAFAPGVVERV